MVQFDPKFIHVGPDLIVIDFFCGGGGVTEGFEKSLVAWVVACINHDDLAILTHTMNHPNAVHFNEDISKMYGFVYHGVVFRSPELLRLKRMIDLYRAFYPNAKIVIWASLECIEFSLAKGGKTKDPGSRTLAKHMEVYIDFLDPDIVQIENVQEFKSWGPLIHKTYKNEYGGESWAIEIKREKIEKVNQKTGKKYKAKGQLVVLQVLVPCPHRKGTEYQGWRERINKMGYRDDWRMMNSADYGAPQSRHRLFGIFARPEIPIVWPQPTHEKDPKPSLFGQKQKWQGVKEVLDLNNLGKSIIWGKKKRAPKTYKKVHEGCMKHIKEFDGDIDFIHHYYGNSYTSSINGPTGAATTKDRFGWVSVKKCCKFIHREFGQTTNSRLDHPIGAIPTVPKAQLCTCVPYLYNHGWGGHLKGVNNPSMTIIASQDKTPLYLLTMVCAETDCMIPVFDDDCEELVKLKHWMAENGFIDICMRCLTVDELKPIQGFPVDYRLAGNQEDQKRQIGNAVVPYMVTAWSITISDELKKRKNDRKVSA
jgi:DNA (cytosine-5)-methyltransferase 1